MAAVKIAAVLRAIGGNVCNTAAQRLEADNNSISLHLRNAGLSAADAVTLSQILQALSTEEASTIDSFSLSYNNEIGNTGATAIAKALPRTLRELGMVGCNIGEQGGRTLLQWAANATDLRVICVEDNQFSTQLKDQFIELKQASKHLLVAV